MKSVGGCATEGSSSCFYQFWLPLLFSQCQMPSFMSISPFSTSPSKPLNSWYCFCFICRRHPNENNMIQQSPPLATLFIIDIRLYPIIHLTWVKVLQHCCITRLCRDLGMVLNDRQFTDVYAGTLICPRSRMLVSQIDFFSFWRRTIVRAFTDFLWSIFTGQFWQTVFVPTQLLNEFS